MVLNCIVIDDEKPARDQIAEYVERIPFLNLLASFSNAIQPIDYLNSNVVDIIFLDIEMEDFTGLQFAKTLSNGPQIILTTAYDQYAIEAFDLDVCDYLLKPISFERFLKSVNKAYKLKNPTMSHQDTPAPADTYAFFKVGYKMQRIDFKDILFIEGQRDYLKIHTENSRYMTLMSFKDIEELLPSDSFMRVHRSFIISIDKIDSVEKNRIYINDHVIPIGEVFRKIFQDRVEPK